jgi:hypothetical protein
MGILLRAQKQAHWSLAVLSGALEFDWSLSRGSTDYFILMCAKYATYSGPDGSLLVLQGVSIADDAAMIFEKMDKLTVLLSCAREIWYTFGANFRPGCKFLVLQIVSVADNSVTVFLTGTN